MSNALTPLIISTTSAILLLPLPVFVLWRFSARNRASPVSLNDYRITHGIMALLVSLHMAEVLKAFYFGFEYNNSERIFEKV
jgi:hypothetical protein